jgi:hypothetical protein
LLRKLNTDLSRTAPEKHHIAMRKANELVARLNTLKQQVNAEVKAVGEEALGSARHYFQMLPSRQALDADIRAWVRETVKQDGGFDVLNQAVTDTPNEFLTVLYSSPHMLLGMTREVHLNLQQKIIRQYTPDIWAQVEQASDMSKLPPKIDGVARQIPTAFYEPHEVEKYATRVEVA